MGELIGVAAGIACSLIGGTAVAGTRYIVGAIDPLGLATLRYGIGALCLAPFAIAGIRRLHSRRDTLATLGLGVLFCALYPYLFTAALAHTTAARGSLVLSTLPLLTLGFAILLGREAFSWRRLTGILLAVGGLFYALSPNLEGVTFSAWRGDLIMATAVLTQAIYNVLARPFIHRVGVLPFTAIGMCMGALVLIAFSSVSGAFDVLPTLDGTAWTAIVYLGVVGCALTFVLWSAGLRLASPALVAITVTVNPITASFLGAFYLSEPVGHQLVIGLLTVLVGIAIATDVLARFRSRTQPA